MYPVNVEVGRKIALRRHELGLTQGFIAEALPKCTAQTVSLYEAGVVSMNITTLAHISMMLSVPIGWFFADYDVPSGELPIADEFFDRDGMRIAQALRGRAELKNMVAAMLSHCVGGKGE